MRNVILATLCLGAMHLFSAEALAQFGACCGSHGGVCGCKDGGVVCCDGFTGSSCPCEEEQKEIRVPGEKDPIQVLPLATATVSTNKPAQVVEKKAEAAAKHGAFLPRKELTPGDVRSSSLTEICAPGYVQSLPRASEANKTQAYKLYGITNRAGYEIDHLVSKGTGGSSEIPNLWPQKRAGAWNMSHKDRLENHLNTLVCSGKLKLKEAQEMLRVDWVAAYRRLLGEPEAPKKPAKAKKSSAKNKK